MRPPHPDLPDQRDGNGPVTRELPLRALALSLAALAVPVGAATFFPAWTMEEAGLLLWLTALVPAFLLTYYRGWWGASVGLAGGMAVLSVTHASLHLLDLGSPNWPFLMGVVTALITICLGVGWLAELLHRERRAAEAMALTDPLTSLANRRHASLILDAQFAGAERGLGLAVAVFDLDHFKDVNDRHGHAQGDLVLRHFAGILRQLCRRMDLPVRWGGEEFLVLLPGTDLEGAERFAGRVAEELRQSVLRCGTVTVSAGVAAFESGMGGPEVLLAAADQALYGAKSAGRDRVRTASGPSARAREERTAPGARARAREERTAAVLSEGQVRVLLVDDDAGSLDGITRLLKRLGYLVYGTTDPTRALVLAAEATPAFDLLVVDLIMPGMSGFTLVEKLEESGVLLPVLYVSGYVQGEVSWGGAPGLRFRFLEKPMTVTELEQAIQGLLTVEVH